MAGLVELSGLGTALRIDILPVAEALPVELNARLRRCQLIIDAFVLLENRSRRFLIVLSGPKSGLKLLGQD